MPLLYRKSSFSQLDCVEVAQLPDGRISLRDSKDRNKPAHEFTATEWSAFIAGAKEGEFDFELDLDLVRSEEASQFRLHSTAVGS